MTLQLIVGIVTLVIGAAITLGVARTPDRAFPMFLGVLISLSGVATIVRELLPEGSPRSMVVPIYAIATAGVLLMMFRKLRRLEEKGSK